MDWVRGRLLPLLREKAAVATAYLTYLLHSIVASLFPVPPADHFKLCDARLFSEEGHSIGVLEDARRMFDEGVFDAIQWSDELGILSHWWLEIRYVLDGRKYRAIVKPAQAFPTISDKVRRRCPSVIKAVLVGKKSGSILDITQRVQKYAGPRNDWHGSILSPFDLFPNDDCEYNAEKGFDIVLIYSNLSRVTIPFAKGVELPKLI